MTPTSSTAHSKTNTKNKDKMHKFKGRLPCDNNNTTKLSWKKRKSTHKLIKNGAFTCPPSSTRNGKKHEERTEPEPIVDYSNENLDFSSETILNKLTSYKPSINVDAKKMAALIKEVSAKKVRAPEDSDSESDDDKEMVIAKSYMDDFDFDKEYNTEMAPTEEAEATTEKEQEEEKEKIRLQRLAIRQHKKNAHKTDLEIERTLCVDNVHVKTNKKALVNLFKKYGKVETIR